MTSDLLWKEWAAIIALTYQGGGAFLLAEQHGSGGRDRAENRAGGAGVAAAQTDPRWVCPGAETHTGAQSLVGGVVCLLGAVKPL